MITPTGKFLLMSCGHFILSPVHKCRACFSSSGGLYTGERNPSVRMNWKLTQKIINMMVRQKEKVEIKRPRNRAEVRGPE